MMESMTENALAMLPGSGWLELGTALVALAATIVSVFQRRKRRTAEGALDSAERMLVGLVSVIEVWKKTRGKGSAHQAELADDLIRQIKTLQEGLGSEGDLRRLVKEVEGLIGSSLDSLDDAGRRERAETAAAAYLERRRKSGRKAGPKPRARRDGGPWPALVLALGLGLGSLAGGCALTGCGGERDWTTETVVGYDATGQVVVVEWPDGVRAVDVWTTETEGRTQSVAWVETDPPAPPEASADDVRDERPPGR
jgi:uncharacterized protein YoxC